jgi:hypothetical protein
LFYNNKTVTEKIIIISNLKIQSKERILNELLRIAQNSKFSSRGGSLPTACLSADRAGRLLWRKKSKLQVKS